MCNKKDTRLRLLESFVLGASPVGEEERSIRGVRNYANGQPFLWFRCFGNDVENPTANAGVSLSLTRGDNITETFQIVSDQIFALPSEGFDVVAFSLNYTGFAVVNLYVEE